MWHGLKLKPIFSTVAPKHHLLRRRFCSSSNSISYPPLDNHRHWSGLRSWRHAPLNHDTFWGPNGPIQQPNQTLTAPLPFSSLAEMGAAVLSTPDPLTKAKLSHLAYTTWRRQQTLPVGVSHAPTAPARPSKPELCSYGDMPAHSVLWRECDKTSDNVTARLAVIPLVQKARGLDAGPRLVNKMIGFGDLRTSNIVAMIADEEVAHVAVGVYWFVSVCQKMGRVPGSTFKDVLEEYKVELKGPFNHTARQEDSLPREWYDPSPSTRKEENKKLSEVYDRLACVISMEHENSSLGR